MVPMVLQEHIRAKEESIVVATTNLPESTTNVGFWAKKSDVIYAMETNIQRSGDIYISVGVICWGKSQGKQLTAARFSAVSGLFFVGIMMVAETRNLWLGEKYSSNWPI